MLIQRSIISKPHHPGCIVQRMSTAYLASGPDQNLGAYHKPITCLSLPHSQIYHCSAFRKRSSVSLCCCLQILQCRDGGLPHVARACTSHQLACALCKGGQSAQPVSAPSPASQHSTSLTKMASSRFDSWRQVWLPLRRAPLYMNLTVDRFAPTVSQKTSKRRAREVFGCVRRATCHKQPPFPPQQTFLNLPSFPGQPQSAAWQGHSNAARMVGPRHWRGKFFDSCRPSIREAISLQLSFNLALQGLQRWRQLADCKAYNN